MTSDDDAGSASLSGAVESAEPDTSPTHQAPAAASASASPTATQGQSAPAASDSVSAAPMRHQTTLAGARSPHSPQSSRNASPARPHQRTAAPPAPANTRAGVSSRRASTDVSPNRDSSLAGSSSSSTAAVQRALSSTSIPQLPPTLSNDSIKAPRPLKNTSSTNLGDKTPHWPISPRLRSPPPPPGSDGRSGSRSRANSLRAQIRKPEAQSTPAIVVQSSSPAPVSRIPVREEAGSDPDEPVLSMKGPSRGASGVAPKLETVQESSLPATPGFGGLEVASFVSPGTTHKVSDEDANDVSSPKVTEDLSSSVCTSKHTGSGSDGGTKAAQKGKMQEQRSASTHRPTHPVSAKPSLSSLSTRSATQPSRNMTVETETVPSVAQSAIGNQDRSSSSRVDGSLRLKPSNETIRPKKEKKPAKRKTPSINAGTASSKADVFEQKVASAVDEADSSDSDATFIYESNPAEQQPHRSRHHPSRTPSITSIASLADLRLAMRDVHKNPNKKSSMKFTNPYNNPSADVDVLDRGDGTIRVGSGRAGGSHHHHIGRHGQGRGALGHLTLDSDSSKAQSSRARGPSSKQASQPNSPRFHSMNVGNGSKKSGDISAAYDMDAENIADDERTPLIPYATHRSHGSDRSQRLRTPRHRNSVTLRIERRHRQSGGWCRQFASCLVLSILLLIVIFSSAALVVATTKPLESVKVEGVQNVIASQDEIMLDLIVFAVNPNIIGVTVSDMDVIIFAKSKHVGSDKWWRDHGNGPKNDKEDWHHVEDDFAVSGVDEGTDPVEGEPRTMSLGRVSHFDTPLNFDGSFFARKRASSIGEIRLSNPGNKTEVGGTDRWEEVLQYPFELIVRGNFKYQLPLSTREQKVPVTASYYYDPDAERRKLTMAETESSEAAEMPKLLSRPVQPKTLGRYDRRALSLPEP